MTTHQTTIDLGAICLDLLPERALYWPATQALLVADLHLGKAEAFRRAGLAIPEGDNADTLQRLDQLIARYQPAELILLGDILHAKLAANSLLPRQFAHWRSQQPDLRITAIAGNHDRDLDRIAHHMEIISEGVIRDGLRLLHHPPAAALESPWVAGHWHPVARLAAGGDSLRLPAFIKEGDLGLILPAFGSLTGGLSVDRNPGRQRYVSSGQKIFALDKQ